MTAAEIKSKHSCRSVLLSKGFTVVVGNGKDDKCLCPFHDDKKPSLEITKTGPDLWVCRAGCGGGDVVDLLARFEGKTASEYLSEISKDASIPSVKVPTTHLDGEKVRTYVKPLFEGLEKASKIVAVYPYHDANGKLVYEAVRYEPKDFRQRCPSADGSYDWAMNGVERVLYRLPEVRKSQEVWIVEGEKDADMLRHLGLTATTNVGGAKKWLDTYAEHLHGKDIVICGDNDAPGKTVGAEHVEMVKESVQHVAKTVRIVQVPWPAKDISDHTEGLSDSEALEVCRALRHAAEPLYQGERLPLKSMAELEAAYKLSIHKDFENCLDMGRWLPLLGNVKLVPGELAVIIAETGVGKTAILTNVALSHPHLNTCYFHLELSNQKAFERSVQTGTGASRYEIHQAYKENREIDWRTGKKLDHVLFCTEAVNLRQLSSIVRRSEIRFAGRPALVLIDYVQLMQGDSNKQNRYERFTDIAEGLKRLAKELNVVIVIASQVNRGKEGESRGFGGLRLSDAKDSGAIENSCALLLGASRNPIGAATEMCIQVLKSTEIGGGLKILCKYDFTNLRITEQGLMR